LRRFAFRVIQAARPQSLPKPHFALLGQRPRHRSCRDRDSWPTAFSRLAAPGQRGPLLRSGRRKESFRIGWSICCRVSKETFPHCELTVSPATVCAIRKNSTNLPFARNASQPRVIFESLTEYFFAQAISGLTDSTGNYQTHAVRRSPSGGAKAKI